jgi:hypothetical protein
MHEYALHMLRVGDVGIPFVVTSGRIGLLHQANMHEMIKSGIVHIVNFEGYRVSRDTSFCPLPKLRFDVAFGCLDPAAHMKGSLITSGYCDFMDDSKEDSYIWPIALMKISQFFSRGN